jgi:hypothetical protein
MIASIILTTTFILGILSLNVDAAESSHHLDRNCEGFIKDVVEHSVSIESSSTSTAGGRRYLQQQDIETD